MAFAAAAAAAVGIVSSMAGKLQEGQAASAAAGYQSMVAQNKAAVDNVNAQIERNNAAMARGDADVAEAYGVRALAAGEAQATAQSMGAAARLGRIKAGQAASGLDVNRGSNVDVRAGTRAQAYLDTQTLENNAAWENYGLRQRARQLRYTADVDTTKAGLYGNSAMLDYAGGAFATAEGQYATQGAALGALGTLAGGASSLPTKFGGGGVGGSGSLPGGVSSDYSAGSGTTY